MRLHPIKPKKPPHKTILQRGETEKLSGELEFLSREDGKRIGGFVIAVRKQRKLGYGMVLARGEMKKRLGEVIPAADEMEKLSSGFIPAHEEVRKHFDGFRCARGEVGKRIDVVIPAGGVMKKHPGEVVPRSDCSGNALSASENLPGRIVCLQKAFHRSYFGPSSITQPRFRLAFLTRRSTPVRLITPENCAMNLTLPFPV